MFIFWVTSQFFLVRKVSKEQHQANAAVEYMDGAPAPGSTVWSEPSDPNDTPSQSDTSVKSSASLSEIEKIAAQPCSKGTSNEYLTLMIQFGMFSKTDSVNRSVNCSAQHIPSSTRENSQY